MSGSAIIERGKVVNRKTVEACELRYRRQARVEKFIAMRMPPEALGHAQEMLDQSIAATDALGIDNAKWDAFSKAYKPEFDRQEQSMETMGNCLVWIRYSQPRMGDGPFDPPPCMAKYGPCSDKCKMHVTATEEQLERFLNGCDI